MAHILAEVRVEGIRAILRALSKEDPILATPWTEALTELTSDLAALTHEWVPRKSGKMEASIKTRIQAKPVPTWGKVQMSVGLSSGVRYGGILHGSTKRHYHYRSGPHLGELTFGWMTKPLEALRPKLQLKLEQVAGEIERIWERQT